MSTVLITGCNGQDGSYLAEFLLDKGCHVVGMIRRSSVGTHDYRIRHLLKDNYFTLVEGDVTDTFSVLRIIKEYRPYQIYNLAAQSHVHTSFSQPSYTSQVNYNGLLHILESLLALDMLDVKVYQASTSEMFGNSPAPQSLESSLVPESPYAISKIAAHHLCKLYRESYDLFICSGILFNHESSRRGREFVTQKIIKQAYEIKEGTRKCFSLGNLDSKRDWGYAGEYVKGMYMMMNQKTPDDYILATGKSHTIREFVDCVAAEMNITNEVDIDSRFIRPAEVNFLQGDYSKAKSKLGWQPKLGMREIIIEMITNYHRWNN